MQIGGCLVTFMGSDRDVIREGHAESFWGASNILLFKLDGNYISVHLFFGTSCMC